MVWLNAELWKVDTKLITRAVHHPSRGWSKSEACAKVNDKVVVRDVFQLSMGWLKEDAPQNAAGTGRKRQHSVGDGRGVADCK